MTLIEKHKFSTLDAMRGVAALCVMTFHFRHLLPHSMRAWPIWGGYIAVDLFFVLSGFVIAFAYDERLRAGMGAGAFMRLRIIRLWPMIWLGTIIGVISMLARNPDQWLPTTMLEIANFFLIPNILVSTAPLFPLNSPHWSLFYEILANVVYVVAFRFLRFGVIAVLLIVAAIGLVGAATTRGNLNVGNDVSEVVFGLSRITYSFFLGVVLCRTRMMWMSRVPVMSNWLILLMTATIMFVPAAGIFRPVFDILAIVVLAPCLVMLGAATDPGPGGHRLAIELAALSYPLYAIHRPIGHMLRGATQVTGISMAIMLPTAMVTLTVASIAIARFYDAPVRRRLSAHWRR